MKRTVLLQTHWRELDFLSIWLGAHSIMNGQFTTDVQYVRAKEKQKLCCVQLLPLLVGLHGWWALNWSVLFSFVFSIQTWHCNGVKCSWLFIHTTVYSYFSYQSQNHLSFFISFTINFCLLYMNFIFVINLFTTVAFEIAASADRFCSWDNNSVSDISIFLEV